jgi:hypothetical protein
VINLPAWRTFNEPGSSTFNLPASANCRIAAAVNCLLNDAISNFVSVEFLPNTFAGLLWPNETAKCSVSFRQACVTAAKSRC